MPPETVYFVASSIDGFIADANGSLDWLTSIEGDAGGISEAFMATVGVQVMGSATYSWLLEHEDLIVQPQKWRQFFGAMRTVVFSSRVLDIPAGADVLVVSGSVASHMAEIRERAGSGIVWVVGGGSLASQFLAEDLLDRIEITVAPVVLGRGTPILTDAVDRSGLHLVEASHRGPFAHLRYEVVRG